MAWETRKRGGRYYTRSHTINGRTVRVYVGRGLLGELAAAEDAERRAKREAERERWRETVAELVELDAHVALLDAATCARVTATLEAAGYHQHERGEWRRRRGKRVDEGDAQGDEGRSGRA